MRLNDYGITINRYSVIMIGVWLSVVSLYSAVGKTNIKFIPSSLAIVIVLISFGPWGMFSVSERSQVNRLKNILEQSKILIDGKIQNETIWVNDSLPKLYSINELKNQGVLSDSLHNEVKSIVEYLDSHHGFSSIKDWYTQDLEAMIDHKDSKGKRTVEFSEAEIYMKSMGLNSNMIYPEYKQNTISYTSDYNVKITSVSGYDYLADFNKYLYSDSEDAIADFTIDNTDYYLKLTNKPPVDLILKSKSETITFKLDKMINVLEKQYTSVYNNIIPQDKMTLKETTTNYDVKIEIHNLETYNKNGKRTINNISGHLFFKRKK
jgi:flagellar biosynthesis protein FliQ